MHTCRADGTGPLIYLKREDLNHTGAHKINNSLGQALLCMRMTKKRIIAETGAGQHGVATVSALRPSVEWGHRCVIDPTLLTQLLDRPRFAPGLG